MDSISALFGFLMALSVATERITEIIKAVPGLSKWLVPSKPQPAGTGEELRKAAIHIIAILVGSLLAWLVKDKLPAAFPIQIKTFPTALVLGAFASGGSAIWNSALDITSEINKQKQLLTTQLAGQSPTPQPAASQAARQPAN